MTSTTFAKVVENAAEILLEAAQPIVFVGEAVAECDELRRIVAALGCPVLLSPGSPCGFTSLRPAVLGRYSFGRRPGVEPIVAQADRALFAFANGSEFITRGGADARDKTIVHLFDDPNDYLRGFRPALSIKAKPAPVLAALADALECRLSTPRSRWYEPLLPPVAPLALPDATVPNRIHPAAAARVIQQELTGDLLVTIEIGGLTAFLLQVLEPGPEQRLFCPIEREACMCEATMAALGFWVAKRGRRVLAIAGDGSLTMMPSELRCAVEENAKVTYLIWSNQGFRAVFEGLEEAFGPNCRLPTGVWLGSEPDFAKVGEGWGLKAYTADSISTLRDALRTSLQNSGPSLIVAHIDPSIVSPMGDRRAMFKPERAAAETGAEGL